jgi:spore coat polysaccharide biosynthesis protein SpsF
MHIVALIQARMGSRRLPCKMMLCLRGLPLIDWVVRRTAVSRLLRRVIVATSTAPADDVLAAHLHERGVEVFRGPEDDVLRRFRLAAEGVGATHIVRVCADNPLIWGGEIDHLIRHYQERLAPPKDDPARSRPDEHRLYAYNHIPLGNLYPDGLGAEMVSFPLLRLLEETAVDPRHREHCLSYIRDNPADFAVSTFDPPDPALRRPEIRLDVDTAEDYRKLALLPLHPDMPPAEALRLAAARSA